MVVKSLYSDKELLAKIANGDQFAFTILYDQYASVVSRRALYILKSDFLAEEVLQDVMIKIWENARKLTDGTQIAAYLTTLTKNRCFEILRRKALEAKINLELGLEWKEHHSETEEQVELSETRRLLDKAVDQLPQQQKSVYKLCKEQGLKYEDAARELNISTETVRSHMKHALRSLRNYLTSHTDLATVIVITKIFFPHINP